MKNNSMKDKWQNFMDKTQSARETTGNVCRSTGKVISMVAKWIYRLRGVLLAIPVAVLAINMALVNMKRLPEAVGINLLANGEFEMIVTRNVAVMGPLAVTAVCLLLMFCSRRVLYPWLISLFSLVLPWLVYITNVFPA